MKSAASMPWARAVRNCRQVGPARRGADARVVQDLPDRGGGDVMAEPDQLTLDAPMFPGRVVGGHADQRGEPEPVRWVVADRPAWRRSTAFSCRRTSSSVSFEASRLFANIMALSRYRISW